PYNGLANRRLQPLGHLTLRLAPTLRRHHSLRTGSWRLQVYVTAVASLLGAPRHGEIPGFHHHRDAVRGDRHSPVGGPQRRAWALSAAQLAGTGRAGAGYRALRGG